ncbi:MAG: ATP-binding protein [Sphaerochaetaceae bacterium]|jgi:energy-coupling factor transporter ATP-binding protein EcfA2|nr:ATP-binding protein [Sphaerochaetaceae bacterium]MDD3163169.1 ATP-binding protein [Sphaerochaetaceae bacterium]MDD4007783.1 ATP-binding protein [Sphaerochaetaceae bacterium]MDD4397509.1 ATP-binding protein [Sphaerochaetaceae bacterium]
MLIEMKVANFRSVKDAQTISFVAMKDSHLPEAKTMQAPGGLNVLKTTAIIGPNGAGKSTFVRALEALKNIITSDDSVENPLLKGFAGTAFAYSEVKGLPSEIEVKVLLPRTTEDGKPLCAIYRLVADMNKIHEESLVYSFGNSKKLMFERKILPTLDDEVVAYKYRWGKMYRGEKRRMEKKLSPQRTYLAEAALKGGETCSELYGWISNSLHIVPMGAATSSEAYMVSELNAHPDWAKQLVDYLWSLDITDIRGIRIKDDKLIFIHTNVTMHYSSSFLSESLSLRRLCVMGIAFFESFSSEKTLVVDDFGMFLHPAVIKHVLGVFEKCSFPGSQLIAVDCNPALLSDGVIRKDGIWFAQKDSAGSTEFYSLADFKVSNVKDKARIMYENGAFGALPLISEFTFTKEAK